MASKSKHDGSLKHRKKVKYSEEQLQKMMERATIKVTDINNDSNGTE